jgi:hypothetical protein
VLILPQMTLDALNRKLIAGACRIAEAPLSSFLAPASEDLADDYYLKRVEFTHFRDMQGGAWTGKTDLPLTNLQLDLYYKAWERAYELLGLDRERMPLFISVACPNPHTPLGPDGERYISDIRLNTSTLEKSGEYRVVAFPTKVLAELGDSIRQRGIPAFAGQGTVLDQIYAFHEARKAAFTAFKEVMEREWQKAAQGGELDGSAADYTAIGRYYSEIIAYAHLRAAFRRRVMGPLRVETLATLSPKLRQRIEQLLLFASRGLYKETRHERDPAYTVILKQLNAQPELKAALEAQPQESRLNTLR